MSEKKNDHSMEQKTLQDLCLLSQSERDFSWEKKLVKAFPKAPLYLQDKEVIVGPDGFSYATVSSTTSVEKVEELDKDVFFHWCVEEGLGIVLNHNEASLPDYVFNYGMVWNFYTRGEFFNFKESPLNTHDQSQGMDTEIQIHEVSEIYLPIHVRKLINSFLLSNKVETPEITLISSQETEKEYELLWYFNSLKNSPQSDKESVLKALSWFLPLDYKLAWVDEKREEFLFKKLV